MSEEQPTDHKANADPATVDRVVLPVWKDNLRHMLGASGVNPGYRNFFCVCTGDDDFMETFGEMEKAGLVSRGRKINNGQNQLFHATTEGCKVIGLSSEEIDLAFSR